MKIKVSFILYEQVFFKCSAGDGVCIWNGELPEIDEEYHVEMDVIDQVVFGGNLTQCSGELEISVVNGKNQIKGTLGVIVYPNQVSSIEFEGEAYTE